MLFSFSVLVSDDLSNSTSLWAVSVLLLASYVLRRISSSVLVFCNMGRERMRENHAESNKLFAYLY
jgi:hypothetical protein